MHDISKKYKFKKSIWAKKFENLKLNTINIQAKELVKQINSTI